MRKHCTKLTQIIMTLVLIFATNVQTIASNLDQISDQQIVSSMQDSHSDDCTEHQSNDNPPHCCQYSSTPFLLGGFVSLPCLVEPPLVHRTYVTLFSYPDNLFRPPIA